VALRAQEPQRTGRLVKDCEHRQRRLRHRDVPAQVPSFTWERSGQRKIGERSK
jgi:hypothetical protein